MVYRKFFNLRRTYFYIYALGVRTCNPQLDFTFNCMWRYNFIETSIYSGSYLTHLAPPTSLPPLGSAIVTVIGGVAVYHLPHCMTLASISISGKHLTPLPEPRNPFQIFGCHRHVKLKKSARATNKSQTCIYGQNKQILLTKLLPAPKQNGKRIKCCVAHFVTFLRVARRPALGQINCSPCLEFPCNRFWAKNATCRMRSASVQSPICFQAIRWHDSNIRRMRHLVSCCGVYLCTYI